MRETLFLGPEKYQLKSVSQEQKQQQVYAVE